MWDTGDDFGVVQHSCRVTLSCIGGR
jgi:hypothetical protein